MADGVQKWYSGKNIFMTGGSGFLGVTLIEKIVRSMPDIGTIYLLLREKKGKPIQDRIDDIKKNSVFESLYKTKTAEEVDRVHCGPRTTEAF